MHTRPSSSRLWLTNVALTLLWLSISYSSAPGSAQAPKTQSQVTVPASSELSVSGQNGPYSPPVAEGGVPKDWRCPDEF